MYEIVCPECGGVNTLIMVHYKTSSYRLRAMPSPTKVDRGTYTSTDKHDLSRTIKVHCTVFSCKYVFEGSPAGKDIVRKVSGDTAAEPLRRLSSGAQP